jgi:hypothetical protein
LLTLFSDLTSNPIRLATVQWFDSSRQRCFEMKLEH